MRLLLALTLCAGALPGAPALERFENRHGSSEAVAGDVIDVIGTGLAAAEANAGWWPLPVKMGATRVLLNGAQAPVVSVSPNRVRIQLPWELAGLAGVQLVVEHDGVGSNPLQIPLSLASPQILGPNAESVSPGQEITLRAIGIGPRQRNPVTATGPTPDAPGIAMMRLLVMIGGVPAPVSADALTTGAPLSDAGVQLVSVQVPSNVQAGSGVPVRLLIGDAVSAPYPVTVLPPAVKISMSPNAVEVPLSGGQTFVASVEGTEDNALTWTLDPNAYPLPNTQRHYGTLSNNGVFSAGYEMPAPNWVIARATHRSGAFATALIRLVSREGKAYRIAPEFPVLAPGESVTFGLQGPEGVNVDNVQWFISDGFFTHHSATYTAPITFAPVRVIVRASLRAETGLWVHVASTAIIISPPRALVTGISPGVAYVGEAISFLGTGLTARAVRIWFAGENGTRIRSVERATTGSGFIVPRGAVSGLVQVEVSAGEEGSAYISAPVQLTVVPRLRLRAERLRVSSGEAVRIKAATPDVPGEWKPAWRADLGTIDEHGVFVAPAVSQPSYARIWGCMDGNNKCSTTIVRVDPMRMDPDLPIVSPGETIQLKVIQGATEVAATWRALTANVTVTASGALTAGTGAFDGGSARVSASYGGSTQTFEIVVRAPGAVVHTAEFHDWLGKDNNNPTGRSPLGTFPVQVFANGDWIYAASRSLEYPGRVGPWLSTWLDVYRLDADRRPVWVEAVEGVANCAGLYVKGTDLYALSGTDPKVLLRYDIRGGRPVLRSRQVWTGDVSEFGVEGHGITVLTSFDDPGPAQLKLLDHSAGTSRTVLTDYTPVATYLARGNASNGWAAVEFFYPFLLNSGAEVVIFDTSGPVAVTLAILPAGGFGRSMAILQDLLVVGRDVFRFKDGQITPVYELPGQHILDFDAATRRLLLSDVNTIQNDGYYVADLSDLENPKFSAAAVHADQSTLGSLGPDYFVLLGGAQNVAAYPILWQRGIRKTDSFRGSPWMNDVRARDGYVYWTGPGWGFHGRSHSFGIFEVTDVSSSPAHAVAAMGRPGDQDGWAIELHGQYAYVGTDSELIVYDISAPTRPVEVMVVPAPAYSLALGGSYLYAGSNFGESKALVVYDISNPAVPRQISTCPLTEFAYGITVGQGWLAVALGNAGLSIYSLDNPAAPVRLTHLSGISWDVAANRNLLYAAAGRAGLRIYDVAAPQSPAVLSITRLDIGTEELTRWFPSALTLSFDARGMVWVCSPREGRVYGLDVREPRHPRHVAQVITSEGYLDYAASAAEVWDGRLYVAGNNAGFDVTAPQNIGLYGAPQTLPGQILPDRLGESVPTSAGPASVLHVETDSSEPMKSGVLNGREPKPAMEQETQPGQQRSRPSRPYRSERPGTIQ